jgi:hypothetical protein
MLYQLDIQKGPSQMVKDFSVIKFLRWTVSGVILIFALYSGALLKFTWPISELSISKAGTFGDSFGALTSLFTGLGFAGLLATVFLQREELKLNRRELEETRKEIRLQSQTFHQQRFEDAFYQMLSLYKENLRELSIRPDENRLDRIYGIEALNYLIKRFGKAWGKYGLHKLPANYDERCEYLFLLTTTIQSVFIRQTRYVETLSNILVLIEDECNPSERKETYWRVLSSQLTAYEINYLFYQALINPEFKPLRSIMLQSNVFQDRLATLNIPEPHRQSFELIWNITLPNKRSMFSSPLSDEQIRTARKTIHRRKAKEFEMNVID